MLQTVRRNVRAALRGGYPFIHGMGKTIDIGNTKALNPGFRVDFINEPLYGDEQSDYDRLKSDWLTVGDDLREAIRIVGGTDVAKQPK